MARLNYFYRNNSCNYYSGNNLNSLHHLQPYLTYLQNHPSEFIQGQDNQVLITQIDTAYSHLSQTLCNLEIYYPPRILIVEPEPTKFFSVLFAASAFNSQIFLGNPYWGTHEWKQVREVCQPDLIIGKYPDVELQYFLPRLPHLTNQSPQIMIPTGGSSGQIKFAVHSWSSLAASVSGFLQHFQVETANFICTLPLYHVSGLMQLLRTLFSGGQLVIYNFHELETATIPPCNPEKYFISLVPTQLQRLLQNPILIPWLQKTQAILLGGAPASADLLNQARSRYLPVALTYGMTETASQIATLLPQQFLQGANHCGSVLPHAEINIIDEAGNILPSSQIGQIQVKSAAVTQGYYGQGKPQDNLQKNQQNIWQTDDLGFLDNEQNLHIVGRCCDKIITGGENVFPSEIEAAILATGLVQDIKIIGVRDRLWGEAVTAIYVVSSVGGNWDRKNDDEEIIKRIKLELRSQLSNYKIPKYWIAVEEIKRNLQGKINRQQLQQIAEDYLQSCIKNLSNG